MNAMATLTVTTASDVVDAGDGVLSLREAVAQSNATATVVDTINFASFIEGETLTLTQGELQITQDVGIDGDTDNNGSRVTLSGGWSGTEERDGSRIVRIEGTSTDVAMRDLTLTHGSAGYSDTVYSDNGGAVLVAGGSLAMVNSVVSENL